MTSTFSIRTGIVSLGILLVLFMIPVGAHAQFNSGGGSGPNSGGGFGPNSGGGVNNSSGGSFSIQNPLQADTLCGLLNGLLRAALTIGIPIAVLFLVWAGMKFVLARGNPERIAGARRNLMYTLMGIALFMGAWFLGQVIANTLNELQPGTIDSANSCR